VLRDDVVDPASGEVLARPGRRSTRRWRHGYGRPGQDVRIRSIASEIIDYLSADREEEVMIAQANTPLDDRGQ
jgi:DNA-directed RNA polymerase subunit beta